MTKDQSSQVLAVLHKENIAAKLDDDNGDENDFYIEVSGVVTADVNDIVERLREDTVEGDPVAIERVCSELIAIGGDPAVPDS
jgi:hypothetical protein